MNTNVTGLVPRFTRTWVRLYTAGLRPDVRDARRAEIESDLWEQRESARTHDEAAAFELFLRLLLGVPADVSWHLEQRRAATLAHAPDVPHIAPRRPSSLREKGWLTVTLLFAVLYVGLGTWDLPAFISAIRAGRFELGSLVFSIVLLSLGSMILAGLRVMKQSPRVGGALVLMGNLPVIVFGGLLSFYIGPLVVVIPAMLSGAGAIIKAQKLAREQDEAGMRGTGGRFMLGGAALIGLLGVLMVAFYFVAITLAVGGPVGWLVLAVLAAAAFAWIVRTRRKEREGAGLRGPGAMSMIGGAILASVPAVLLAGLVFAGIVLTLFGFAGAAVLAAVALVVAAWIVRSRRLEELKAAQQDRMREA